LRVTRKHFFKEKKSKKARRKKPNVQSLKIFTEDENLKAGKREIKN
jgi:hypothetical protein